MKFNWLHPLLLILSSSTLTPCHGASPTQTREEKESSNTAVVKAPVISSHAFEIKNIEFKGLKTNRSSVDMIGFQKNWVGQRFSAENGQKIIATLLGTDEVSQVELYERNGTLVIACQSKPKLASLDVWVHEGQRSEQVKSLFEAELGQAGFLVGAQVDPNQIEAALSKASQRCKEALNIKSIRVQHQFLPILNNRALLLKLSVWLGEPVTLNQIKILHASPKFLNKIQAQFPNPSCISRNVWAKKIFQPTIDFAAIQSMNSVIGNLYVEEGRDAQVGAPVVLFSPSKEKMFIHHIIEQEGQEHLWGDCQVSGDGPTLKLLKNFQVPVFSGQPYKSSETELIKGKLLDYFKKIGFYQATVDIIEEPRDDDSHLVDVRLFCRSGPQTYIRNVKFEGRLEVHEPTLRKLLKSKPSSLMSQDNLNQDRAVLEALPCFDRVGAEFRPVEGHPERFDLVFKLDRNTDDNFNLTLKSAENGKRMPKFSFILKKGNFLYRGRQIKLEMDLSKVTEKTEKSSGPILNPSFAERLQNWIKRENQVDADLEYIDRVSLGASRSLNVKLKGAINFSPFSLNSPQQASTETWVQESNFPESRRYLTTAVAEGSGGVGQSIFSPRTEIKVMCLLSKGNVSFFTNTLNYQLFNQSAYPGELYQSLISDKACLESEVGEYFSRFFKSSGGEAAEMAGLIKLYPYRSRSFKLTLEHRSLNFHHQEGLQGQASFTHFSNFFGEKALSVGALQSMAREPWGANHIVQGHVKHYFHQKSVKWLPRLFRWDLCCSLPCENLFYSKPRPYPWMASELEPLSTLFSTVNFSMLDYRDSQVMYLRCLPSLNPHQGPQYFIDRTAKLEAGDGTKDRDGETEKALRFAGSSGYLGFGCGALLPSEALLPPSESLSMKVWAFGNLFALLKDPSFLLLEKLLDSKVGKDWQFNRESKFYQAMKKNSTVTPVKLSIGLWFNFRIPLPIIPTLSVRVFMNLKPFFDSFLPKLYAERFPLGGIDKEAYEGSSFSPYRHMGFDFQVGNPIF